MRSKALLHRINVLLLSIFLTAAAHFAHGSSLKNTIIISDIDDTIQHTQVRPESDSYLAKTKHIFKLARNVLKNHDAFIGMSQLYMMLAARGAEFHYVSGAPKSITRLPEKFLQTAGFPVGELSVRPSTEVTTAAFKFDRIAEIIEANPGKKIILIGDNGEKDVTVYKRISTLWRLKGRVERVYIHDLYPESVGEKLYYNQIPYLTAADLALQFHEDKLITTEQTREIAELVKQGMNSKYGNIRERAFPTYATLDPKNLRMIGEEVEMLKDPVVKSTMSDILMGLSQRLRARAANKCSTLF